MKKIALISAIAISSLFYNSANAQIRLHFGIHLGLPPVYIPARVVVQQQPAEYCEPTNYDGDEDYYYLPQVDAYYSVPEQCYYYNDGGNWVSAAYLPGEYRDFDWRSAQRYEVRAPRPFMHNDYYRTRFNGVNFNGRWGRGFDRGYANNYRFNQNQYRNDNQRPDNRGWNRDDRQYNQNREQHVDNRGQDNHGNNQGHDQQMRNDQHYAQNNAPRSNGGWNGGNAHRQARF